jgi:hypothetical protein
MSSLIASLLRILLLHEAFPALFDWTDFDGCRPGTDRFSRTGANHRIPVISGTFKFRIRYDQIDVYIEVPSGNYKNKLHKAGEASAANRTQVQAA